MGQHAEQERREAELEQGAARLRPAEPVRRRVKAGAPVVDAARRERDLDTVAGQVRASLGMSPPDVIRRSRTKNKKKKAAAKKAPGQQSAPVRQPTPEELAAQARQKREIDQQAEGSPWQAKIQEMSRPVVGPHQWSVPAKQPTDGSAFDPNVRPLPGKMERRRENVLGPMLAQHPQKIAERDKAEAERAAAEQKELDDAPYRTPEAQALLTQKHEAANAKVKTATASAKGVGLPVGQMSTLHTRCNGARTSQSWYELDNLLDELGTEAQKMISYAKGLATADGRITDLPGRLQKKKVALRTDFMAFRRLASATNRDDDVVSAKLEKLLDDIQVEEDAVTARSNAQTAAAAEAARRAGLRGQGRWPGNDDPAAEIATATRATVGGSADERAAVLEALDTPKRPSDKPSWARKWAVRHGNGEGNLPGIPGGGGYLEYYVRPPGSVVGDARLTAAGARRLVVHTASKRVYYCYNHYGSPDGTNLPAFVLVTDA